MIELDFNPQSRFLITGGNGLVGSALSSYLKTMSYTNVICLGRKDCDLKDMKATSRLFKEIKPDYVFHLAATVYGIMGNMRNQGLSFLENSLMNLSVIEASREANVKKIVAMGTSAAYPDPALSFPLVEEEFLYGEPHYSEYGYAQAKRSMLAGLNAYNKSYGMKFAYVISTNLYGPHDKFDVEFGHVIPSLIRKFFEAKHTGSNVSVWGDGSPKRDFMFSEDAAKALFLILKHIDGPVNMASGSVHSIKDVVDILSDYLDMQKRVQWDNTKPNGQLYRQFSIGKLSKIGFKPQIDIKQGLQLAYNWYADNLKEARV